MLSFNLNMNFIIFSDIVTLYGMCDAKLVVLKVCYYCLLTFINTDSDSFSLLTILMATF